MLGDHLIPIAGYINANERMNGSPTGMLEDLTQHHVLNSSLQHPTTHQPGIDPPLAWRGRSADHHADHAVVAEHIVQSSLQREDIRIRFSRQYFWFGITPGC